MEITDDVVSELADLVEIATPRFARLAKRAHDEGLLIPILAGNRQAARERMCKLICVQIGSFPFLCLPDEATGANLCLLSSEFLPSSLALPPDKATET
jgi:hypothetical protein